MRDPDGEELPNGSQAGTETFDDDAMTLSEDPPTCGKSDGTTP